jgi:hypothetical protein
MSKIPATRARSKRRSPERALHMDVAAYLRHAWPADLHLSHFPAGEVRDKATAGKLKAMGLARGWPDFIAILPNGQAAFLELKAPGGSLSDEQKDLRRKFIALGCAYSVATSLDEVERIITRWLAAFGRAPLAQIVRRTV